MQAPAAQPDLLALFRSALEQAARKSHQRHAQCSAVAEVYPQGILVEPHALGTNNSFHALSIRSRFAATIQSRSRILSTSPSFAQYIPGVLKLHAVPSAKLLSRFRQQFTGRNV